MYTDRTLESIDVLSTGCVDTLMDGWSGSIESESMNIVVLLAAHVQPQVSQSYCFTIAMDHGTKGCMDGSMIQLTQTNYNASSPV